MGEGRLLLAERFPQFRELVVRCAAREEAGRVVLGDLHGFWDMIHIQVAALTCRDTDGLQVRDVHSKLVRLAELEAAGWTEEEEQCCHFKKKTHCQKKRDRIETHILTK